MSTENNGIKLFKKGDQLIISIDNVPDTLENIIAGMVGSAVKVASGITAEKSEEEPAPDLSEAKEITQPKQEIKQEPKQENQPRHEPKEAPKQESQPKQEPKNVTPQTQEPNLLPEEKELLSLVGKNLDEKELEAVKPKVIQFASKNARIKAVGLDNSLRIASLITANEVGKILKDNQMKDINMFIQNCPKSVKTSAVNQLVVFIRKMAIK